METVNVCFEKDFGSNIFQHLTHWRYCKCHHCCVNGAWKGSSNYTTVYSQLYWKHSCRHHRPTPLLTTKHETKAAGNSNKPYASPCAKHKWSWGWGWKAALSESPKTKENGAMAGCGWKSGIMRCTVSKCDSWCSFTHARLSFSWRLTFSPLYPSVHDIFKNRCAGWRVLWPFYIGIVELHWNYILVWLLHHNSTGTWLNYRSTTLHCQRSPPRRRFSAMRKAPKVLKRYSRMNHRWSPPNAALGTVKRQTVGKISWEYVHQRDK